VAWQGLHPRQRKFLREALYMPALVAARYNQDLRQKNQILIQAGKPAKVALTALMRKLIEIANAPVRQNREGTVLPAHETKHLIRDQDQMILPQNS